MSNLEPQPDIKSGPSLDWLDPENVSLALISSDMSEAARQLERTSGVGVDPANAKVVGSGVLPSEVEQIADWPDSETSYQSPKYFK